MLKIICGAVIMLMPSGAFSDEIKISPCAAWSQNDSGGLVIYGCDDLDTMQQMATDAYNAQKASPEEKIVVIIIVPSSASQ